MYLDTGGIDMAIKESGNSGNNFQKTNVVIRVIIAIMVTAALCLLGSCLFDCICATTITSFVKIGKRELPMVISLIGMSTTLYLSLKLMEQTKLADDRANRQIDEQKSIAMIVYKIELVKDIDHILFQLDQIASTLSSLSRNDGRFKNTSDLYIEVARQICRSDFLQGLPNFKYKIDLIFYDTEYEYDYSIINDTKSDYLEINNRFVENCNKYYPENGGIHNGGPSVEKIFINDCMLLKKNIEKLYEEILNLKKDIVKKSKITRG